MADESIATIDRQLSNPPNKRSTIMPSRKLIQSQMNIHSEKEMYPKNVKSNFNLSFNNSFNTSFGATAQQNKNPTVVRTATHSLEDTIDMEQKPEVSFTAEANNSKGKMLISQGKFSVDIEKLEE